MKINSQSILQKTQHAKYCTDYDWKMESNFDSLDHSMMLAKLSAYGFDNNFLNFAQSYLSKKFQKCKIENDFSSWREITTGVFQGCIPGPLLSNIFVNEIFLFVQSSKSRN